MAEGKLRHGGGCLSPLQGGSAKAGTWQPWDSQPQLVPGSSPKGWWDHGAPLLPDRQAAPGRVLPALGVWRAHIASAGRGSAHGSKDVPVPARAPWAGGVGCPQLRAAFHLLPGRGFAFRHLLPARPEAKRAAGRADVRDVAALPARPLAGRGVARRPRWAMGAEAASHPTHPTHPTPSSSAQGGLSWDGAWQSPGPETVAPCTFPAKLSIAFSSCNEWEEQELGCRRGVQVRAGGEGGLLEHAWSAVCACLGTRVRVSVHVCVLRRVCIYGEIDR